MDNDHIKTDPNQDGFGQDQVDDPDLFVNITKTANSDKDVRKMIDAYHKARQKSTVSTSIERKAEKRKLRIKHIILSLVSIALVAALVVILLSGRYYAEPAMDPEVAISIIILNF